MLSLLVDALREYGRPRTLYLDNGSTYRGEALAVACHRLSIRLAHAQPYDPQARGKMERFWRTARERCIDHLAGLGLACMTCKLGCLPFSIVTTCRCLTRACSAAARPMSSPPIGSMPILYPTPSCTPRSPSGVPGTCARTARSRSAASTGRSRTATSRAARSPSLGRSSSPAERPGSSTRTGRSVFASLDPVANGLRPKRNREADPAGHRRDRLRSGDRRARCVHLGREADG